MKYEKPNQPPTFCMFLRKQIEGGRIINIEQKDNDRVITFTIQRRNEIGDLLDKKLIVEVMGRYSNIIITDDNFKILEAIKHQMPFDGTDRTLFPGAIYEYPHTTQINPYDTIDLDAHMLGINNENFNERNKSLMGFSPLINKEILHRSKQNNKHINDVIKDVMNEYKPCIIYNNRNNFYYTDITYLEGDRKFYSSINEVLDNYYYNKDRIDITKQHSKDLIKFTKNYRAKLLNKIDKLTRDLHSTDKMDEIRVKGELIQANLHTIIKGDNKLICNNYYTDQEVTIMLDNRLTPIQNSEKYFKKYKKVKTSIPHLNGQIKDAKLELKYIYQINTQIENASLKDIEEIKTELVNRKLIKRSITRKKRKVKPNYETYYDQLGIEILVGKNNLQNQYITHKLAKHNEVWFHVKEAPGSHVVGRTNFPLEETTIRTCAQLAAFYSSYKNSNSVAVDYVEVRYIKKVPGKINSFVTYKNHKTIFIDPDEDFIKNLQKK
jgi:predicted ribosome quality control (RQC) complex YloA/Tae2 family protein